MADTFRASVRIYLIMDLTFKDRLIGTYGLTYVAVNTFTCDFQCHINEPFGSGAPRGLS